MLAELVGSPDTPWRERRATTEQFAAAFVPPDGLRFTPGKLGAVDCEWVLPADASPAPVFMHLHGGGYVMGMPAASRPLTAQLAGSKTMRVVSIDYAIAPEKPFPAAVDDAVAAYRALIQSGVSPKQIAIGGESAGGGLAVATLVAARDAGLPMPASAVALSPWTDMRCSSASFETKAGVDPLLTRRSLSAMADAYLSGADRKAPLASPNLADLRGLPPLLIQTGSDEVLLDDAVGLDAAAKRQGVETTLEIWPGMIHVWHMFHPLLPEAGQAVAGIVRHLRKHW